MAIKIDLASSQYGVPFAGAYFRIVHASAQRTRAANTRFMVALNVAGYATQPTDEETNNVDFRVYHAPLAEVEAQTGPDWLAKCYQWVMAQPDMAGSTAV
jgi:hypothetical protein